MADPTDLDPNQDPNPTDPTDGDLGDAGKKALEAERKARRDAEKVARDTQAKLKEFEDRDKSDLQKLQDDLAARDAQLAELPAKIRADVVRFASAAATAGFVDPEDALLNLGDVDLGDSEAVSAALTALAERKPHLVRQSNAPKPADRIPTRPKAGSGQPTGAPASDPKADAKERAADALRALSGSR